MATEGGMAVVGAMAAAGAGTAEDIRATEGARAAEGTSDADSDAEGARAHISQLYIVHCHSPPASQSAHGTWRGDVIAVVTSHALLPSGDDVMDFFNRSQS